MKRPSFQFYPGDWLNDAALRLVSVEARGLWIEMICIMHQGSEYGYLKVNHKVILPNDLARMCGASIAKVNKWIFELKEAGVCSISESNCIFSRRMIRDEEIRKTRAAGGVLGGNPALKGSGKVGNKDNLEHNLTPTPSSSSSSSSSSASTKSKPVKDKNTALVAPVDIFPEIENRQIISDWLAIRKAKDAPVTKTALDGISREARKAGMQIDDTIRMCCERNWASFKASWLDGDGKGVEASNDQARETARAMLFGGA